MIGRLLRWLLGAPHSPRTQTDPGTEPRPQPADEAPPAKAANDAPGASPYRTPALAPPPDLEPIPGALFMFGTTTIRVARVEITPHVVTITLPTRSEPWTPGLVVLANASAHGLVGALPILLRVKGETVFAHASAVAQNMPPNRVQFALIGEPLSAKHRPGVH